MSEVSKELLGKTESQPCVPTEPITVTETSFSPRHLPLSLFSNRNQTDQSFILKVRCNPPHTHTHMRTRGGGGGVGFSCREAVVHGPLSLGADCCCLAAADCWTEKLQTELSVESVGQPHLCCGAESAASTVDNPEVLFASLSA